MKFVGRQVEIQQLKEQFQKKKACLVTVQGRRRIGKSTLIKHFADTQNILIYEFQGLAPRQGITNRDQLNNFANTLAGYLNIKKLELDNWSQAFAQLDKLPDVRTRRCLILLDEISWMGEHDPDFTGKLKEQWDRSLNQLHGIMLVLCGSVSSWIQKNILKNTGFVGRVSLVIYLKELSITESYSLLDRGHKKLTITDFAQIISITGGVPRYLEEINTRHTPENNIKSLCFNSSGLLFNEFDQIFSETFGRRHTLYSTILKALEKAPLQPIQLAKKIKHPLNGDLIEYISDLEFSGFLRRDYSWNFAGKESRLSQLRISDNYVRFYLKYILSRKSRLIKKPILISDTLDFIHWPAAFGYQFENLILNNIDQIVKLTGIVNSEIIQLGPFFQTGTKMRPGVQIDFLIQCRKGLLYLYEIKSGSKIGAEIVQEVQEKTKRLKIPKGFSVRHYLIHLGELSDSILTTDYFDKIINFEDLLLF